MTGIDTNVLVMFYINDDPEQHKLVHRLFEQSSIENPIFINIIVLIEWFWALDTVYKIPKEDIIEEIYFLLYAKEIVIQHPGEVKQALQNYEDQNFNFSDLLIGELNGRYRCETTYTFDRQASKLASFTALE